VDCTEKSEVRRANLISSQLPQKFLFIHAVLEGLSAIDENHRNLIVKLAPKFAVGVNVDFPPDESTAARQLGKALLYDFAQVTSFAGVDDDVADLGHAGKIVARKKAKYPETNAGRMVGPKFVPNRRRQ
jgi:hypothetical protein